MQITFYTENKGRSNKHYGIGLSFAQAVAKSTMENLYYKIPQRVERQLVYLLKIASKDAIFFLNKS